MVVIAVIAILAALLLPALNRTRDVARRAHCISNQRQLTLALNLYFDTYSEITISTEAWIELLSRHRYLPNLITARCPTWPVRSSSTTLTRSVYGMRDMNADKHVQKLIQQPSKYVFFADSIANRSTAGYSYKQYYVFYGEKGLNANAVHYRHNKTAVASFADGSVRACIYDELKNLGCPKFCYAPLGQPTEE